MERKRALWLIDAAYLLNSQRQCGENYQFDYRKLREYIERDGAIWHAYYLNSTPNPPSDRQDAFHTWLRSAPPNGPKIVTELYQLKRQPVDRAFCETCNEVVEVRCAPTRQLATQHPLHKEVQKGVDVGIATLALVHIAEYNTLILSSGDGDLLDAVEYVITHGKNFEIVAFAGNTVSTELQSRADRIYWINEFAEDVKRAHQAPRTSRDAT